MRLFVVFLSIAVITALSGALYVHAGLLSALDEDRVIEVERGQSVIGISARLHSEGIVDAAPLIIRAYIAMTGVTVKAGEYRVTAGTSGYDAIRQLQSGKVLLRSVTFPEGWTVKDWRRRLAGQADITQTIGTMSDGEVAAKLGLETPLEGWLYPDTYHYPRGTTDLDVLLMAVTAMQQHLTAAWQGRDTSLPLETPFEALILASIVEKETGFAPDRRKIASVFHNRLVKGMKLQSDPTVIFGLGDQFDGDLKRSHLRADTPYNSYTRHGLPPGPICSPGLAAIEATLNPEASGYYYFVAKGNGESYFSTSLTEHNRAVNRYQRGQP